MTPKQQAYRQKLERQYVGDGQGFLYAEACAMLSGRLPMSLGESHQDAINCEVKSRLSGFFNKFKKQELF